MDTTVPGSHPGVPPSHRGAFAPGQQFGPWVIERELARGGQGAILVARHVQLGHHAALKLLLHGDERSRGRFLREAKVLARLKHPNVPTIHDMGEHMGATFMAMELVEGQDLYARLKAHGVPDFAWTARVMAQVARIVQACHDQGILHRDLKPHNVLIEDGSERPVLVDFGLLKKDDSVENGLSVSGGSLSLAGEMAGTPAYMAPEQADSSLGEPGRWTDVYALGATLFHLLTGAPPYDGTTNYNVITKLLAAKRAPDASKVDPAIPASLAALCAEAMAPEPGDRLDSAHEFAERLDEAADVLEGKALPARRGLPRRASLLASAVFALAGAGAAAAILLSAGPPPTGTLVVRSDHAAELWEGEQLLTQLEAHTPAEVALPAGPHALTAKVGGQARPLEVDVPAAGRTEHGVSFTGDLAISKPDGATVSVRDAAGTPAVDVQGEPATDLAGAVLLRLLQGEYDLELKLDGHHPRVTRVALGAEPLDVKLEPGKPEARPLGLPRGTGVRAAPLVTDVDGDGVRDLVAICPPAVDQRRNGNDAEVVAFSGRNGDVLWSYPGPVNQFGGLALRTVGDHAPAIVASEIRWGEPGQERPGVVCLDPATGEPKHQLFLDDRPPYQRTPLGPIPLDPEGTGSRGYAFVHDGQDKAYPRKVHPFVSLCLQGPAELQQDHAVLLYPEALGKPWRPSYGLRVTPLFKDGAAYALLWFYGRKTLVLEIPSGRLLQELQPDRAPISRGGLDVPPPSRLGTLVGWSLEATAAAPTGVELALLDPETREAIWQREVVTGAALGGRGLVRFERAKGADPWLVVATDAGEIRIVEEATGKEVAHVDHLRGRLAEPRTFHAGERRLLVVCQDAQDGGQTSATLLDPARGFEVVWERALDHPGYYRFLSVADLDGDGHDELITSQEGNRLLVISPAVPD